MTQEYEFFKDFAGVTKADLEMFKCGGGMKKVKKAEDGIKAKSKKQTSVNQPPKRKVVGNYNIDQGTERIINHGRGYMNDTTRVYTNPVTGKSYPVMVTNGKEEPTTMKQAKEGRTNPRRKK